MSPDCASDAASLASRPRYLWLRPNLVAVQFPLMKLLPARALVAAAPGASALIESSSGTMGLALATVAAPLGIPLTLVTPRLSHALRTHLGAIGSTRLIEVDGDQNERLERLAAELARTPSLHWTRQYSNPAVPAAYASVAADLARLEIDSVVVPVGSGGCATGLVSHLRRSRPAARLIVVDAMNSVLFGRPDGKRLTSGLGNSLVPANLVHRLVDTVHWMSDLALSMEARNAMKKHGLFIGPTGAGALRAALWHADADPASRYAAILPDEGHRYLDTVFRDARSIELASPRRMNVTDAQRLSSADDDAIWLICDWGRRSLSAPLAK